VITIKGLIFNIQRYSIHDGEGIRTLIFFKGCPLHCPWCCNPESQSGAIEQAKMDERCIHCETCSHTPEDCPSEAITNFGKSMSVEEIIKEVEKDRIFYDASCGGVTLSGGEVLSQFPFALALLNRLEELAVHSTLETSGYGNGQELLKLAKYLDCILFDLKIMNQQRARAILGVDNRIILENFQLLLQNHKQVIPRIPLIPGYTMDDENIAEIIAFIKASGLQEVHLLPFHQYGSKKYAYLNKPYALQHVNLPGLEVLERIKEKMAAQGLSVVVGGM
jgi:pyruvate formate lyase activating enzyme